MHVSHTESAQFAPNSNMTVCRSTITYTHAPKPCTQVHTSTFILCSTCTQSCRIKQTDVCITHNNLLWLLNCKFKCLHGLLTFTYTCCIVIGKSRWANASEATWDVYTRTFTIAWVRGLTLINIYKSINTFRTEKRTYREKTPSRSSKHFQIYNFERN